MTTNQFSKTSTLSESGQAAPTGRLALVVDDNFAFRTLAVALLQKRGFAVRQAEDAEEALMRLRSDSFDLVLLDLRMPGMQGGELCGIIRRQLGLRHLPIIAYTADGLGTSLQIAQEAGFDDLLLKPVDHAKLDQILAERFPD